MNIFKKNIILTSILVGILGVSQSSFAASVDTENDGVRQVNQVRWDKTGDIGFTPMPSMDIPNNQANLVFIRPKDNASVQSSANIGIDGRFQVSLQGGSFSQVLACSGKHDISVTPTGFKNNLLSTEDLQVVNITPNQNHYFFIEIDETTGASKLIKITEKSALNVLNSKSLQTHQISRVIADCKPEPVVIVPPPVTVLSEPVIEPKPVTPPPKKVELDRPIALDVLFEFDSAKVQSVYSQRLKDVSMFMTKYPETVVRIEGHTDSVGSSTYNLNLSEQRANSVKNELINKYGVDMSRVSSAGFGETKPVASNDTADGRQRNRRVVAIISKR